MPACLLDFTVFAYVFYICAHSQAARSVKRESERKVKKKNQIGSLGAPHETTGALSQVKSGPKNTLEKTAS